MYCRDTCFGRRCRLSICATINKYDSKKKKKKNPKPQPPVPNVVREDKPLELVDTHLLKSSTSSTLLSTVLTLGVEEAVEEEVEAVVEEVDHLLASLHLQGRARLLYQLQQTLK